MVSKNIEDKAMEYAYNHFFCNVGEDGWRDNLIPLESCEHTPVNLLIAEAEALKWDFICFYADVTKE